MKKLFVLAAIASSLAIGMMAPGIAVASTYSDDDDGGPIVSNPPPTSGPPAPPQVRDPSYDGAASGQLNGLVNGHSFNTTNGGSASGLVGNNGSAASGSVSATTRQSIQAYGVANYSGATPGQASGSGNADITYYMTVYGPGDLTVPLIATGYLLTSASSNHGFANTDALFSVYSPEGITGGQGYSFTPQTANTAQAELLCDSGAFQAGCGRLDFTIDFNLAPGQIAALYLYALAGASAGDYSTLTTGSAQAEAIADPLFSIDPTWAAAHPGYQLAFSSGIVNGATSAAPEPGAWALSILGLVVVGGALRCRRRRTQQAVA